jgi:hypothetical protein
MSQETNYFSTTTQVGPTITIHLFALACAVCFASVVLARVFLVNDWLSSAILATPISMIFGLLFGYNAERLKCAWMFTKHSKGK